MKKYRYTVSTNTIWTSFDYGEVEANDYQEAKFIALEELQHNFDKANKALKLLEMTIEFDKSQVEITEI